jgi:hypothetical protein
MFMPISWMDLILWWWWGDKVRENRMEAFE